MSPANREGSGIVHRRNSNMTSSLGISVSCSLRITIFAKSCGK
jgi:hypothetical protein